METLRVCSACAGDVVHVNVHGAAQDVPVRLMRRCICMDATYVTMSSQKLVTISNRSDVIVHFRWTRFATPQAEQQHRARSVVLSVASYSFHGSSFFRCVSWLPHS